MLVLNFIIVNDGAIKLHNAEKSKVKTFKNFEFTFKAPGESFGILEPAFLHHQPEPADEAAAAPVAVVAIGSHDERNDWESGRPDYLGRAAFDNILKKIDASVSSPKTGKAFLFVVFQLII